jgi:hypothetical protein
MDVVATLYGGGLMMALNFGGGNFQTKVLSTSDVGSVYLLE